MDRWIDGWTPGLEEGEKNDFWLPVLYFSRYLTSVKKEIHRLAKQLAGRKKK